MTTLQQELRSGRNETIDYLISRFTCNMRNFGDWGAHFRHTMKDALMIDGSVHHLDILADLAGQSATRSIHRLRIQRGVSMAAIPKGW